MSLRRVMIAIVACLFVAVASAGSDCSDIKVGSSTWNLGSLPTKGPYTTQNVDGSSFSYGICAPIPTACSNGVCGSPGVAGVCQTWNQGKDSACCGTANNVIVYSAYSGGSGTGLSITYSNGDTCNECRTARASVINIVCDVATTWDLAPVVTGTQTGVVPNPIYTINLKHIGGCPTNTPGYIFPSGGGGISPGSVLLIIFFVTFFVYIVAGCVINKFVRVKEGREIFPNVDFWTGLPGLVKDGFGFIIGKCRGTKPDTYRTLENGQ